MSDRPVVTVSLDEAVARVSFVRAPEDGHLIGLVEGTPGITQDEVAAAILGCGAASGIGIRGERVAAVLVAAGREVRAELHKLGLDVTPGQLAEVILAFLQGIAGGTAMHRDRGDGVFSVVGGDDDDRPA